MYFSIHELSDKGNRKTKKTNYEFLEFNKTEIASCVSLSQRCTSIMKF